MIEGTVYATNRTTVTLSLSQSDEPNQPLVSIAPLSPTQVCFNHSL